MKKTRFLQTPYQAPALNANRRLMAFAIFEDLEKPIQGVVKIAGSLSNGKLLSWEVPITNHHPSTSFPGPGGGGASTFQRYAGFSMIRDLQEDRSKYYYNDPQLSVITKELIKNEIRRLGVRYPFDFSHLCHSSFSWKCLGHLSGISYQYPGFRFSLPFFVLSFWRVLEITPFP